MFNQTFDTPDLLTLAVVAVLESVMSVDNALVLGVLSMRLPPRLRGRVLFYGLFGALVLRIIAIVLAAFLLKLSIIKLAGGTYLVYVGLRHFLLPSKKPHEVEPVTVANDSSPMFWSTVFWIEVTDLAFAVDSILAAVALVGPARQALSAPASQAWVAGYQHPKLWVIVAGGMIGVVATPSPTPAGRSGPTIP